MARGMRKDSIEDLVNRMDFPDSNPEEYPPDHDIIYFGHKKRLSIHREDFELLRTIVSNAAVRRWRDGRS